MSQRFQAASLVSSPCYPNAVAWSHENLVAVASGSLVTILNPSKPCGPRGLVSILSSQPFPIGVVERQDLLSDCLLPYCLSRETQPQVRSISWSPIGLAPNSGCLLAVCTTEGDVKLYRMPFLEFSAEWVEVMDISEMLHTYLLNFNYTGPGTISLENVEKLISHDNMDRLCADDLPISVWRKEYNRKRKNAVSIASNELKNLDENSMYQIVPVPAKPKTLKEDQNAPFITVQQYSSRSAMMASLVLAWSPVLKITPEIDGTVPHNSSSCCSILAVGGKSGKVSFWRIRYLQCYSISNKEASFTATLIGFPLAHDNWITAISWVTSVSSLSNHDFLLATGSCDGSVKLWQLNCKEMLKSSETNHASCSLLKEVLAGDSLSVSALSLVMPTQSAHEMLLAIGKGSGSFEVWNYDIRTRNLDKIGCYDAHNHIITGLAWAFNGCCLYTCSQDNSIASWIIHGNSLREVAMPSNIPGVKSSSNVPNAFDSCYGIAVSPGNMAIAVARKFDADQLNPMYQERTLKAAVEFLWIGGQQLDLSTNNCREYDVGPFPGFDEQESFWWEKNVLWSLNRCSVGHPLIVWDTVAALLAFKKSIPKFVDHILEKWLSSYFGPQFCISTNLLSQACNFMSKLSSCQLHLLNIICRHVVLRNLKSEETISKHRAMVVTGREDEQKNVWMELLSSSEKELQERLVGLTFSAISSLPSNSLIDICKGGCWSPIGLAQMEQWVSLNSEKLKDHLKLLAAKVGKSKKRKIAAETVALELEEWCCFCSAEVPFSSTEVAFCSGVGQSHKFTRCSVSMRICPKAPLWFCACCQRHAAKLAPSALFTMREYPSDFEPFVESPSYMKSGAASCPFCGILLQRSQPEFLLSPSPV